MGFHRFRSKTPARRSLASPADFPRNSAPRCTNRERGDRPPRSSREKQEERFGHLPPEERPEKMLPLIRLRVVYSRMEPGTFVRFGQNFVDKVANPKDILHFSKKKAPPKKRNGE